MWYGACNASCRKTLQRIVRAAEMIVGVSLPSLQDVYSTRLTRKALCIAGDPTHPTHSFFSLLPSGRRLRSLQARTNRLKDSFIDQAVRKLNSLYIYILYIYIYIYIRGVTIRVFLLNHSVWGFRFGTHINRTIDSLDVWKIKVVPLRSTTQPKRRNRYRAVCPVITSPCWVESSLQLNC